MIDELLKFNEAFVAEKGYEKYITTKYPDKKIAIVTCMDTRLVTSLLVGLEKRTFVFIQTNVRSDENVRTFRLERAGVFFLGGDYI